ncbi:MAG: isoaspartyl peptidase/L-asparaginase [Cyclobacteriaceae bacterium]|nr:isoaspartyl peptidase/L-asparaginase [Cyclobacteriaceae bacterium]
MKRYSLAIHGGAGTILPSEMDAQKELNYTGALKEALAGGQEILASGGSSLDAVETAVRILEDCPLFNAGRGSVFNAAGKHEMEASIMDGATLAAGAVSGISLIKNPVSLARKVKDNSDFVYMSGLGAMDFAREQKVKLMDDAYFFDEYRHAQWLAVKDSSLARLDHSLLKEKKFGTVGAVAFDSQGNLAAATSTGGLTNKKYGRIGDSPIIGAGNYANNATCAVSCTGYGEYFIRGVVAYDVSALMEYKNLSLEEASRYVIKEKMVKLGGEGGLIAIDRQGKISIQFNSEGMYRAWVSADDDPVVKIFL